MFIPESQQSNEFGIGAVEMTVQPDTVLNPWYSTDEKSSGTLICLLDLVGDSIEVSSRCASLLAGWVQKHAMWEAGAGDQLLQLLQEWRTLLFLLTFLAAFFSRRHTLALLG